MNISNEEKNLKYNSFLKLIGYDAFITNKVKISESFLCKITNKLLLEPVILDNSGITYEKSSILEHFTNKGKYDPISK